MSSQKKSVKFVTSTPKTGILKNKILHDNKQQWSQTSKSKPTKRNDDSKKTFEISKKNLNENRGKENVGRENTGKSRAPVVRSNSEPRFDLQRKLRSLKFQESNRNRSMEEMKKNDSPKIQQQPKKESPAKKMVDKSVERKKEELRKKAIDAMLIAEQRRVRLEEMEACKENAEPILEMKPLKKIPMKEAAKLEQEMIEKAKQEKEIVLALDEKEKKRIENLRKMKQQRILEHLAEQEKRKKLEAQNFQKQPMIQEIARSPQPGNSQDQEPHITPAKTSVIPIKDRIRICYEIDELKMMNPYRGSHLNFL